MASTILFVSGKFLSFKNDGTTNNGGLVYFWEPGTSTPKTTYSDSALTTPNAHPVVLDAAGWAVIYFSGNADLTVKDSASVTLYTQPNVNPDVTDYVTTVGGTADVITLTPSPAITAYATGQRFSFIASGANTTNVTVNINGLGAKAVTKSGATPLLANQISANAVILIEYDGTQFQLLNQLEYPLVSTDTNTAFGYTALDSSTANGNNTAVGYNSLTANTTGINNTAVGENALDANTVGVSNTAVGSNALIANTTGTDNTAVGYSSLSANTTGIQNTAVGENAGSNITTGTNDTCLGYGAVATTATVANQFTLGNASIATLRCQVTTITALSDERDKTNIEDIPLGLDFIKTLRPRRFIWAMRDGAKVGIVEAGFIAQELRAAQRQKDAEWLGLVYDENPERLEATPGKLLPVLVRAVQELAMENIFLRERILVLETNA